MNDQSSSNTLDDIFCWINSTMGDSQVFLKVREWAENVLCGKDEHVSPSEEAETLRDVARATIVTGAARIGLVKVGQGTVESHNIFESSWRLKSFFEGPGRKYDSNRDYAGSVLIACTETPSHQVYQTFGTPLKQLAMKVAELRSAGKVITGSVDNDGIRPMLPLKERARWSFIKQNVDAREGLWKTGNSKRLLAGISEEIYLHSQHAIDRAYDDVFQPPMKYKRGNVTRTMPADSCCVVAISYKHGGPTRMSREDFHSITEALRPHFTSVRLWVDACIQSGSDVMKWVHIGLTPYVCMPVVILHNTAYKQGYDRVWITLERRLALKGSEVISVGGDLELEQGTGVSEHDNLKSVCSDLLGGRISRQGLTVDSDFDDLVLWARSVMMLPQGAVPIHAENGNTLADYYSSTFAKKILISNELSKVNGGAERNWIELAAKRETKCWTSSTLYSIESGSLTDIEECSLLPDSVLENLIVLDVAVSTPENEYEVPCWYATTEGTFIVYKVRLQVSKCGQKKHVLAIRRIPNGMCRPYADLLAEAMLVGATEVELQSGRSNLHEMWATTPAKYNIIKGSEANWQ